MRGHCLVNGVEKHVKCAYVGVNGKAQYIIKPPGVYPHDYFSSYNSGHTTNTSLAYANIAGGYINGNIVLIGGYGGDVTTNDVRYFKFDIKTNSATELNPTPSGDSFNSRNGVATISSGIYTHPARYGIHKFDMNLTHTTISCSNTIASAACSLTNKAVFAGAGIIKSGSYSRSALCIDGNNDTITRMSDVYTESIVGVVACPSCDNNYAIFAGGGTGPTTKDKIASVVAYNSSSLEKIELSSLSTARSEMVPAKTSKYSIFASGSYPSYSYVEAYDKSLTKISLTNLSTRRYASCGFILNGDSAVFAYGARSDYYRETPVDTIDAYDSDLVMTTYTRSGYGVHQHGSVQINNNLAVIAGGFRSLSAPNANKLGFVDEIMAYSFDD